LLLLLLLLLLFVVVVVVGWCRGSRTLSILRHQTALKHQELCVLGGSRTAGWEDPRHLFLSALDATKEWITLLQLLVLAQPA